MKRSLIFIVLKIVEIAGVALVLFLCNRLFWCVENHLRVPPIADPSVGFQIFGTFMGFAMAFAALIVFPMLCFGLLLCLRDAVKANWKLAGRLARKDRT